MNIADEFKTIDVVLASGAETLGVDAFALSLIKAEKQARKLVTFLVYQHSWCSQATVPTLRAELESSRKVYFDGLLKGWDALYPLPVSQLVGPKYAHLRARLSAATMHRNKIFHGQLTAQGLSRKDLVGFVADIRAWCEALGAGAMSEVGFDGCGRNSFRKASNATALHASFRLRLANVAAYKKFIKSHMEQP
ncbi:MAG: hypothetical protein ABL986_00170 [Vicinamibacterales bacterium]